MTKWELIEETIQTNKAKLTRDGALVVETGKFTGRAAKHRFIVRKPEVDKTIHWGDGNKSITPEQGAELLKSIKQKLSGTKVYTYKGFVGGLAIEVTTTSPWHAIFANNMFRETPVRELAEKFTNGETIRIFHDPYGKATDHIEFESDTIIALDAVDLTVCISGTVYAGEIKKSAFSLCNYLLPEFGMFPMHASANCMEGGGESSILFGLSGTGKTTLSAAPDRQLIGDDEIIWGQDGLCNLEGGCYAKLIDLSCDAEPEIFAAANRFGTILENVVMDDETRTIDFCDGSKTENTRASYDLSALNNTFNQNTLAKHPKTIVFLTADAFGALPAVARLDGFQAQYHFISGYTAKVAGTELGVTEPQTAFSACFGAPFMPRHPATYARMLDEYCKKHGVTVWLLNTGWTKGGYGKGPRFPISVSRELLRGIQSGTLNRSEMVKHPIFGFDVPKSCPLVDDEYLEIPMGAHVAELAQKFVTNMETVGAGAVSEEIVTKGGPDLSKVAELNPKVPTQGL